MNYRQWKKNYKKKHGYNPPFEEDKRQQAKTARKALKNMPEYTSSVYSAAGELAKRLAPALMDAMSTICNALSSAFKGAGEALEDMADNYKRAAAVYNEEQKESEVKL